MTGEERSAREALDIVGSLYDCAIEPRLWPQALERLCGFVEAANAGISVSDPTTLETRVEVNWNLGPTFLADLSASKLDFNPFLSALWFMDVDEVTTPSRYMGEEPFQNSRFYKEVMLPYGACDAAMAVLAKSSNRVGCLTLPRGFDQGPYTAGQLAKIALLAPHVRRAALIADLLNMNALKCDTMTAALDLVAAGVVLVDWDMRIVHANGTAERMLDGPHAVHRTGSTLFARDVKAAAELREAVAHAAQGRIARFPKAGIAVPVPSESSPGLSAWVLPLDTGLRKVFAAPFAAIAAIFLCELGATPPFAGELFLRRYGISSAECRVLTLLVQGATPRETADILGIAANTMKSHLAKLFEKTGTHSQAELLRLAMTALAPARTAALDRPAALGA